jgi:hypothetical protein
VLRLRHPLATIKRRTPCGAVGDPKGTSAGGKRDASRILQHRVGIRGYAGKIGGQIGDDIAIWAITAIVALLGASASGGYDADRDKRAWARLRLTSFMTLSSLRLERWLTAAKARAAISRSEPSVLTALLQR